MRGALVLLLLGSALVAQEVTPLQMPPKMRLRDVVYADVNGDGLDDLVLATEGAERGLRVYLQKKGARPFEGEPDHVLTPVWKDAVAFAVGDVFPDPGAEIVLFAAKGVYVWRYGASEKERARKLARCELLWQLPVRTHVVAWPEGVRDIDGDGRVDMVVPEPEGYRVLFQRAPGEFTARKVVVPGDPRSLEDLTALSGFRRRLPRSRKEIRMSIAVDATGMAVRWRGPLLEVADEIPAPQLADFDGDGDLDLLAQSEKMLFVWEQDKNGFPERPRHALQAPVVADRGRKLEVSYSTHALDLNRDQRVDCVIFSGDQRSDEVRTQVQFFTRARGKTLFGKDALPDQMLVLAGFAGRPRWADVDGDGYVDMLVGAVRPDLLDSLAGGDRIDVELYLFLSRKGVFPRRPDMVHRTKLEASGMRFAQRTVMAQFFGDATGDGLRDLLIRDEERRVRVLMTRRSRNGLTILPKPLWELNIAYDAQLRLGPSRGARKAPDLLVLERNQILHVRFP